jgi:hypothetical protein
MRGVAHISFAGGGVFLPARNPYDREILVEHVADRVRSKGELQVALDDHCWSVCMSDVGASCASCGAALDSACYSVANGLAAYCVRCAFGHPADASDT